jgi:hypothetical protein
MFESKNEAVMGLQLKRNVLFVLPTDNQVYAANGGNGKIVIGEEVARVCLVIQKDNSANALVHFAAASIAISGTGNTEIVVTGLVLDANDVVQVVYEVAN